VLLDAVVQGLAQLPETTLEKLPRMADFALWATACETALWPAGTFWSAYSGNRQGAVDNVLDADAVAVAVRTLMASRTEWSGTATDLLDALIQVGGERVSDSKSWPNTPRALSGRLRRAATFLREIGIEIGFNRGEGKKRLRVITIAVRTPPTPENSPVESSVASAQSDFAAEPRFGSGLAASDGEGQGGIAAVRVEFPKIPAETGADGADANLETDSVAPETGAARFRARI
jgi:hypothetical protein